MKPPRMESKNVEPIKLVRVLAEPVRSKPITKLKYNPKLTMIAINPMFSNPNKPIKNLANKKPGT